MQGFGKCISVAIGATLARVNFALLATAAIYPSMAQAQAAQPGRISYAIPAASLGSALAQFGERSNLQVLYPADLARGRNSRAVSGNLTREEALSRLLRGTGLSYRFTNATTVTLIETTGATTADADTGSIVLDPITIDSRIESAWGQVGYVAKQGSAGMKTDTPLIETPQSISVVTAKEIEAQGAQTLGAALRYVPGVTGELYGGDLRGNGLQLRGFSAYDEVFYVDGLRLRGTDYASFLTLDVYGADGLEIMRGPSSVLYGQIGPGGMINYVSKRPTEETIREVELSAGSFDRYQAQFDVSGKLDEEGVLTGRVTGLFRDGGTFVDYVEDDRIFLSSALKWAPDAETSLTFLAKYQKDKQGWGNQFLPARGTVLPNSNGTLPISRFVGEPGHDYYNTSMAMLGYEFEHTFNDTWTIRQNARYAYLDNEAFGVFGSGLDANEQTYERYTDAGRVTAGTFTIDNQAEANFETGALTHKLLLGLDYQYTDYSDFGAGGSIDPLEDIFNPVYGAPITPLDPYQDADKKQNQFGIYAQDQIKLGNWAFTLGGRHDWSKTKIDDNLNDSASEQSDSAFTGRAGVVYLAENGLAPYASYSTSFMPELGSDPSGDPFEPETGEQYEIGVKYQPTGWNSFITVAAFDLTKQNVVRKFGNVTDQTGEIRSRGIEVEGVASLTAGLDLRLAYTYLDTEVTKGDEVTQDHVPYGVPSHKASLWADYTIQSGRFEGLGLGAGIRYMGSTYGDDANSFKVPSATLVDASVHYAWKDLDFKLNVTNLFDKRYVASCFDESFGCFYGEGRRVTGTVKYSW